MKTHTYLTPWPPPFWFKNSQSIVGLLRNILLGEGRVNLRNERGTETEIVGKRGKRMNE